jgi:hypothetical protein
MLICGVVEAQKVDSDFRYTTNFAELKSFAIKEGQMIDNVLVNDRITRVITDTLVLKGLSKADNPVVYVVPNLTTETRRKVTTFNAGFGLPSFYGPYGWDSPYRWGGRYRYYGGYGWDWGGLTSYQVRTVRYDTLRVDMIDGKTGSLLWRGTGVAKVNPHWNPEKIDRKTDELVRKVMRNYPRPLDDD